MRSGEPHFTSYESDVASSSRAADGTWAALQPSDFCRNPVDYMGMHTDVPRVAARLPSTFIAFAVSACLTSASTAAGQAVPLQARDAEVTNDGSLQYALTNLGSQAATAWSVTVTMTEPNGSIIQQYAVTMDEYLAEAGQPPVPVPDGDITTSLLRPQVPRHFTLTGGFDYRWLLTVNPVAIVFVDGTSAGQAPLIERIFRRRAAERDAIKEVVRQLSDVQDRYAGTSALRHAIAALSRAPDMDPANVHLTAEQRLRRALARAGSDESEATRALGQEIALTRRELQAAARHSIRKSQ